MTLSILIATLESRDSKREALVQSLYSQPGSEHVQILMSRDRGLKLGGQTRGWKRDSLLRGAKGDFIVFMDDDDSVPNDYIQSILDHCKDGVDCIGHLFACNGYPGDKGMQLACVSSRYKTWENNVDGFRYVRHTHHLVPVRREHALKAGFNPAMDEGEDHAYSMRLQKLGLLKKEAFIDKVLYTIHHDPHKKFGE
jgi:hypothetical protein